MRFFSTIPFHVFLLSIFPTLAILTQNLDELYFSEVAFPIFVSLLLVFVVWYFVNLLVRNISKSALIISIAFFIFRPFSDLNLLLGIIPIPLYISIARIQIMFFFISIVWMIIFSRFVKKGIQKTTLIFNIFALTFVITPVFLIMKTEINRLRQPLNYSNELRFRAENLKSTFLPDIYYIIIDRYANEDTLKKTYQFDNSAFYTTLRNRGFFIAEESAANYPFTIPSLASSLNLDYLDKYTVNLSKNSDDKTPLLKLIEQNTLVKYLKGRGYKYYHFGARWVTDYATNSDYRYAYTPTSVNETEEQLSQLSHNTDNFVGRFLYNNNLTVTKDLFSQQLNNGNYLLDQLLQASKIASDSGPKFVFIHSLLTHDPYVFDETGKYKDEYATNLLTGSHPLYLGQLKFANKLLINLIDTILKTSKSPPIIILQSDEGPYPKAFRNTYPNFDWTTATDEDLREKVRILNALYLPGKKPAEVYHSLSPVNNFRLVLNLYLGEALPLLPDKNYIQTSWNKSYDLIDITEKMK